MALIIALISGTFCAVILMIVSLIGLREDVMIEERFIRYILIMLASIFILSAWYAFLKGGLCLF